MPQSPRCAQKAAHKLCKPSNHVTPRYRVPLPAPTLRVFPTSPNATGLPESMVGMHPSKLNSSKFDGREPLRKMEMQRRVFGAWIDRKSTRLNSSHLVISYAVFCLKKKKQ